MVEITVTFLGNPHYFLKPILELKMLDLRSDLFRCSLEQIEYSIIALAKGRSLRHRRTIVFLHESQGAIDKITQYIG